MLLLSHESFLCGCALRYARLQPHYALGMPAQKGERLLGAAQVQVIQHAAAVDDVKGAAIDFDRQFHVNT